MTNLRVLTVLTFLFCLSMSCQNAKTEGGDGATDEQVSNTDSPENQAMATVDQMVQALQTSADMRMTTKSAVQVGNETGQATLASDANSLRRVTFRSQDGNGSVERNIYLSEGEQARFLRSVAVVNDCEGGNPCVRETKVYFDENGNAMAAFVRQANNTTDATQLGGTEFTESYDFDTYNSMVEQHLQQLQGNATVAQPKEKEESSAGKTQPKQQSSKPDYPRISYSPGTTAQVSGAVQGSSTRQYIVELPAGTSLNYQLVTDNPAARLMVTDLTGKRLSTAGKQVSFAAPSAGDYLVKVFMNLGNSASSQTADFKLQIKQ